MYHTNTSSRGTDEEKKLPLPLLVGICLAIVAGTVFFIVRGMQPVVAPYATETKNTAANPHVADDTAWLREVAQKSGGDMTKLSEAERTRLNIMTRGNGAAALQGMAKTK